MQQLAITLSVLATLAGTPALAADMAAKAPPQAPPGPVFSWTGWYIGANGGYGWADPRSDTTLTDFGGTILPGFATSHSDALKFSGAVGGVQAGFNWQASKQWIAGLEADWQATSENASLHYFDPYTVFGIPFNTVGAATTDYRASLLWFGTIRGRIGYELNDHLLLYATGGLAYGQVRVAGSVNDSGIFFIAPFNGTTSFSNSEVRVGWTIGSGLEGALTNNWSWKAEYLYVDLGAMNTIVPGPFAPTTAESVALHTRFTENIVRVGLNYKFH